MIRDVVGGRGGGGGGGVGGGGGDGGTILFGKVGEEIRPLSTSIPTLSSSSLIFSTTSSEACVDARGDNGNDSAVEENGRATHWTHEAHSHHS